MIKKVLLGALVGGVVLFVWGFLSHAVLGLHDPHISQIPNEEAVLDVMQSNLKEPGLYFYPWLDHDAATEESMKEWTEKYKAGPSGILVYMPSGGDPMSPKQLGGQFACELGAALIAAFLLALSGGPATFAKRVLFVGLLGVFASIVIDFPYWNWYAFPTGYTVAQVIDHAIGWSLAGLVLAYFVKPLAA